MAGKNILYVTDNLISSSVYRSQVHTLCNKHSLNNNVKLLAFCKSSDMLYHPHDAQYELIKIKRPILFTIPIISKILSFFFKDNKLIEWADVIHCRGHGPSLIIFNILKKYGLNKKVIVDVRGALVNEISEISGNPLYKFLSNQILLTERKIFKSADYLFFVSENMLNHFSGLYEFNRSNTEIFPTLVNDDYFKIMPDMREKLRASMDINDKFVYVYSGGVSYWQKLENILFAYKDLTLKSDDYFLLILTTDENEVKKIINSIGLNENTYCIKSLRYEEVGSYLNAGDAGLIIRDDSVVNYVASPTKVNEYISCGLKIVDNLDCLGNKEYTASRWVNNFLSLDEIVDKQQRVYEALS